MALQRTRRPRIRSGRSLCSLGSPLNARPLGDVKILQWLLAFLVAGLLGPYALADGTKAAPRVTGFFSDMTWVEEAGDVVGMEVFIVYSSHGMSGQHWAYVQIAEGLPSEPAS
jgi:hypothetical protein